MIDKEDLNALKPCPFCGGEELSVCDSDEQDPTEDDLQFYVFCTCCGTCSAPHTDAQDMVKWWNMRSKEDFERHMEEAIEKSRQ